MSFTQIRDLVDQLARGHVQAGTADHHQDDHAAEQLDAGNVLRPRRHAPHDRGRAMFPRLRPADPGLGEDIDRLEGRQLVEPQGRLDIGAV